MNPFYKILTKLLCKNVGCDEFGNQYFQSRAINSEGKFRRLVIYKGGNETSKIPALWHSWMHYTIDDPNIAKNHQNHSWQKVHLPNLTGTKNAYNPLKSSNLAINKDDESKIRKKVSADYESWQPNSENKKS